MKLVIARGDLERSTFRCGGPGGQFTNKVETGVRWTHKDTGLVASSCLHRTQGQNSEEALRLLVNKIRAKYEEGLRTSGQGRYDAKADAAFGRHIRSYVLHGPNQRVVDHRTGANHTSPKSVLDGDLDRFFVRNSG